MVKYKVIDNFLPEGYHNHLLNLMTKSETFAWSYRPNISLHDKENDSLHDYGFNHILDDKSPYHLLFYPLLLQGLDVAKTMKLAISKIKRARADMTTYSGKEHTHPPHVDFTDMPHISCVYYVNDSDGDTILYNEEYDFSWRGIDTYDDKIKNLTELYRCSPKANRAFFFNGLNLHTGQSPSKNKIRTIINLNYA